MALLSRSIYNRVGFGANWNYSMHIAHSSPNAHPSFPRIYPDRRLSPASSLFVADECTSLGSLQRSIPYFSLNSNSSFQTKKSKYAHSTSREMRLTTIRASSTTPRSEEPKPNLFTTVINAIKVLLNQILKPMRDFGFGKRSMKEGAVGLFLVTAGVILALTLSWVKGTYHKSRTTRYQAVFEFVQACGIAVGTPVRIRGVDVGTVVSVKPSLKQIDVVVELMDQGVIIPKNALIEVNQSGLISETLIDITPRDPIPEPTVSPLDPRCAEEGLIVCDREHIKGEQGVSLDELVGICTKLAKQVDQENIKDMFASMRTVNTLANDVKPLLIKVKEMATEMAPMLKEVRRGDLLKNLESLTQVATDAAKDLRKLNNAVLTNENTDLLRQSVSTLTKTLKHIESISKDISGLTGDEATRHNLKQLIESLSRLVSD